MTQSNTQARKPLLVGLVTITPTHPGVGRAPGVVDLPVARDPLGYPYIPGSEVKGAIKSLLINNLQNSDEENKRKVECLLGREPGVSGVEGASMVSITDFTLLLMPVPSLNLGVAYVTSPYLLGQAQNMASVSNQDDKPPLKELLSIKTPGTTAGNGKVYIGLDEYKLNALTDKTGLEKLDNWLSSISGIFSKVKVSDRLVILPVEDAARQIEKGLIRYTRVRLDRKTKTAAGGGLWTEEYIPPAALFIGLFIPTGFKPNNCNKTQNNNAANQLWNLLLEKAGDKKGAALVIGGKESVGKGLVRLQKIESTK